MNKSLIVLVLGLLIVLFQNCGAPQGTETGNPSVKLDFSSYTLAANQTLRADLCVFQVRLKKVGSAENEGNLVSFPKGHVRLDPQGTDLGRLALPSGTYERIDMLLKSDCSTTSSIEIENNQGLFRSSQPLTLRFLGTIEIPSQGGTLTLQIQPFIQHLQSVTSDLELRSGLETVTGTYMNP